MPAFRPPESPASAELLGRVLDCLAPHLSRVVEDFYDRLARDHRVRAVVERLTEAQFEHLKGQQVEHLRLLLGPGLDPRVQLERSREVGTVHAMVGVDLDVYTAAVAEHRRGVLAAIEAYAGHLDVPTAQALVTERFIDDLHGALLGFRDIDAEQHRVMMRVLHAVTTAHTVSDLAQGLVDALGTLSGVVVVLFMRTDDGGRIQYEVGGGPGFDRARRETPWGEVSPVDALAASATGQGPIGVAWRSGDIDTCDSWQNDRRMHPWQEAAVQLGWRSSAAVPLRAGTGRTAALLSLQAERTGFFAFSLRQAFLEQVKQVAEQALGDLERQPSVASAVTNHHDREIHLRGLASGQVEMYFQPVIALPSGRLNRLEALARMHVGDRVVGPGEFLPTFGDDQLFDLFETGLHQALSAMRGWEAEGLRTDVSVNLPVVAVDDARYVRLVHDVLAGYAVDPGRLTLELLETGYVDAELRRRRHFLDDLKDLGVRLAQDDLGSGYSSLLRLRHFAFDDVKIDQSLVRGTELAPGAALHFIQPIRDIAHSQGLSVVIEGLEDDGLIEAAVALGVDEGQGYGIARPMPGGDVVAWERGWRLEVDPARPRTALGALAGHIAWERRVGALAGHPGSESLLGLESCTLTSYLRGCGDGEAAAAHAETHARQGADPHGRRARWEHLAAVVSRRT